MNEPTSIPTDAVPTRAVLTGMEDNSGVYLPAKICRGVKLNTFLLFRFWLSNQC